jgi:undecaprenyl diphosphate synthase
MSALPRHVGIIMDGNGRWAQLRGQPRLEGHRVGAESVRDITRAARQLGLEAITLYAFSAQNWARPADEVRGLMELLRDYLHDERAEIMDNQIRLHAIGDLDRLPAMVREPLDALRRDSAEQPRHDADARAVVRRARVAGHRGRGPRPRRRRRQGRGPRRSTPSGSALPAHRRCLPPVDLLIRTSGEQRISNFLLWELAYAELMFIDVMWPDFRRDALYRCLEQYAGRERRFGLTGAQVAGSDSDVESHD